MRTTRVLLAVLLAVLLPALAAATDAPHDKSYLPNNCQQCHQLHNALGNSLTSQASITDICLSCHSTFGGANHRLGFPWATGDQALIATGKGVSGTHHRWDAPAVSTVVPGTDVPTDPEMASRVLGGKLECSVCHNQHAANKAFAPTTSIYTSYAVGAANQKTRGTGTGTLTLVSVNASSAMAKGYRVRVVGAGLVAVSHDAGLSWFKPTSTSGAAWTADTTPPAGAAYATSVPLAMDDPAVTVQLAAGAAALDEWDFYVSFPMLRSPNLTGSLCLTCHQDRAQMHGDVEAGGDGIKVFSHPVGEALNANAKGYDVAVPLDADGSVQGANTDANPTNDLVLGTGGVVGCTTCHAPHNADSNSLTVDPR